MVVLAILRHSRLSCTKACLVANQVRGLNVLKALNILRFSTKKAARILLKLLESAIANSRNKNISVDGLRIISIYANKALYFKRLGTKAKGRSSKILKRNCHITLELG